MSIRVVNKYPKFGCRRNHPDLKYPLSERCFFEACFLVTEICAVPDGIPFLRPNGRLHDETCSNFVWWLTLTSFSAWLNLKKLDIIWEIISDVQLDFPFDTISNNF